MYTRIIERARGNLNTLEKKLIRGLKIYAKIAASMKGVRILLSIYRKTKPETPKIAKNNVLGFIEDMVNLL